MIISAVTIIGAAHRDQTIRVTGAAHMNRTNPAIGFSRAGGVAANIARHITTDRDGKNKKLQFIGATARDQGDELASQFRAIGVKSHFVTVDGPTPSYTAILDNAGDLIIGAACMDLYDAVTPADIIPHLPRTGTVVTDANFPANVLAAIAAEIPMALSLFAAGTSVEKVDRLRPILPRLDGLVLNRAEAQQITGMDEPSQMARILIAQMRPRAFVLVSDGGDDAVLAQDDHLVICSPPSLETADNPAGNPNVNGAGDAMAARLFMRYAEGASKQRQDEDGLRALLSDALAAGANYAAGKTNQRTG